MFNVTMYIPHKISLRFRINRVAVARDIILFTRASLKFIQYTHVVLRQNPASDEDGIAFFNRIKGYPFIQP